MITFMIDEIVPCLRNTETGDIEETEVVRIKRKSFLSKFNQKTGWFVNWSKFKNDVEIYALVLKGTMDIQGLVAVKPEKESMAVHIIWACTAPQNNIYMFHKKKYSGVGGHLLAIASDISIKSGYDGVVFGEAIDRKIWEHYCLEYGATVLPGAKYRFMINESVAKNLMEVYNYEWTEDEI